jgi:hypothetical protein
MSKENGLSGRQQRQNPRTAGSLATTRDRPNTLLSPSKPA